MLIVRVAVWLGVSLRDHNPFHKGSQESKPPGPKPQIYHSLRIPTLKRRLFLRRPKTPLGSLRFFHPIHWSGSNRGFLGSIDFSNTKKNNEEANCVGLFKNWANGPVKEKFKHYVYYEVCNPQHPKNNRTLFMLPASLRTRGNSLFLHALTSHTCYDATPRLVHTCSKKTTGWGGVGGGRNCMRWLRTKGKLVDWKNPNTFQETLPKPQTKKTCYLAKWNNISPT